MFKSPRKAILLALSTFVIVAALPGLALAGHGNGNGHGNSSTTNGNGGGPPACRDLQGDLDTLQQMVTSLTQTVNTVNTNVNTVNATVSTLSGRIDTINSNLESLQATVDDIEAALAAQGIGGLQVDVSVDEAACVSGSTQCSSSIAANNTNQNPVALNVLVMRGSTPVTDLSSSNFVISTDFGPGGAPANLVLCTSGDTGCGTGSFVVNSGNGGYQLWLSPTSNWLPGTYTVQLKVTDNLGHGSTQLVKITIPA